MIIKMKRAFLIVFVVFMVSCGTRDHSRNEKVISVSIAPFEFFIREIAGDDFYVNVMVPAGASPHVYEPYPGQIRELRRSAAYISNGYLGFEMAWLERLYEVNRSMIRLSLSDALDPIEEGHHHEGEHSETADPHYWISPKYASVIARSVRDLLVSLNKEEAPKYNANYEVLLEKIITLDRKAKELFSSFRGEAFITYHPTLAYLARDYGLEEISLEQDGKEPSPAHLKELIDLAREKRISKIFLTREYDVRQVKALADETGAEVVVIDPLSDNWLDAVTRIVDSLHESFVQSLK
jgi:zinc transport system substrate-binding protein